PACTRTLHVLEFVASLLIPCSPTSTLFPYTTLFRSLLFNSLPVLLTFDLYYQNTFTRDASLEFSVETLYRRTEGAPVVVLITALDRKSTRLNSSHEWISYAVFCLKKKNYKQKSIAS